ncbi:MAG: hypothetical protein IPM06_19945 [Rhizobiales bacterium]|nr:hypothetical protein [Hyphomicrobiales bacterium]
MEPTPTPLDVIFLRNHLVSALAAVEAGAESVVPLRRQLVEDILRALQSPFRVAKTWDAESLRLAVFAEMRRLSPAGEGVSKARWDQQRSDDLPSSQQLCRLLHGQWSDLVTDAGLKANRHTRRVAEDDCALDDGEPTTAPEAITNDGLQVIAKRVETRTAGNVRTVTEFYTLR